MPIFVFLVMSKGSAGASVSEPHKLVDGHSLAACSLCLATIFCSSVPCFLPCFYHCLHCIVHNQQRFFSWLKTEHFCCLREIVWKSGIWKLVNFLFYVFFNIYITISEMPKLLFSILNAKSGHFFFFLFSFDPISHLVPFIFNYKCVYTHTRTHVFMQGDFEGNGMDGVIET